MSGGVYVAMDRLGKRHEARVPFKKTVDLAPDGRGLTMHPLQHITRSRKQGTPLFHSPSVTNQGGLDEDQYSHNERDRHDRPAGIGCAAEPGETARRHADHFAIGRQNA